MGPYLTTSIGPGCIHIMPGGVKNNVNTNQVALGTHFNGVREENGEPVGNEQDSLGQERKQKPGNLRKTDNTPLFTPYTTSKRPEEPATWPASTNTVSWKTLTSPWKAYHLAFLTRTGDLCNNNIRCWQQNKT